MTLPHSTPEHLRSADAASTSRLDEPTAPLVSIVTPCFNGAAHVGRLIQSVLDQTYPNIEFILVNDGSTDSTDAVVSSFREELEGRLTRFVYVQQENAGLGGAINAGLEHATGEYLCWPDADDFLEPDSVLARVHVLVSNPEYAVVTSDAYLRDETDFATVIGRISAAYQHNHDPWQFEHLLRAESIFTPGCHMARMVSFDETHPGRRIFPARRGQNWQMLLPLYHKYKRYYLDVPLYNYVVRPSSMSRGDDTTQRLVERADEHRDIQRRTLGTIPMELDERSRWERVIDEVHARRLLSAGLQTSGTKVAATSYETLRSLGALTPRDRLRYALKRTTANIVKAQRQHCEPSLTSSVLVTTYNGERFIEEQLTSILIQTRPVQEVLICDDGSSDNTARIVRDFLEQHDLNNWSFVVNERNLGPAANVLSHLVTLETDLVFLADQDDVWEPNKVEVITRHLQQHPDCALAVSRSCLVDAAGQPLGKRTVKHRRIGMALPRRVREPRVRTLTFGDFVGYSRIPLHAMCVRSNVVEQIRDSSGWPALSRSLGADWYIGIVASVTGRCALLPDRLVRRRVHDTNISLGRLRKTTALAATPHRRRLMLTEARTAHESLLRTQSIADMLTPQQHALLHCMVEYLSERVAFAEDPSVLKAASLLRRGPLYLRSTGSPSRALRMWVADVMYAYNINWTLRRRRVHV